MGKCLETLKNISKDKNKEKLIYILVAAVVILISSSYIFNEEEKSESVSSNVEDNYIYNLSNLEERLSSILCKIDGVSNVSCFITYKDQGTTIPVYNENKDVIYSQISNEKQVLIEKVLSPTVEGVIIVGTGMATPEMQSKIATAVASVMNIGVYKVQVFNKEVVS